MLRLEVRTCVLALLTCRNEGPAQRVTRKIKLTLNDIYLHKLIAFGNTDCP